MRKHAGWTAIAVAAAMALGTGASIAAEKKAPEFGTWQYQEALETGSLPPAERVMEAGADGGEVRGFPTIELGGVVFRIGLDTH